MIITTPILATFKLAGRDADDLYARIHERAQDLAGARQWSVLSITADPHLETEGGIVYSWEAEVTVKIMGG